MSSAKIKRGPRGGTRKTKKPKGTRSPAFGLKSLIRSLSGRKAARVEATGWSRFFFLSAVSCVIFLCGAIFWNSGWLPRQIDLQLKQAYGLTADSGLAVADVLVEGRHRNSAAAILAKLDVERGSPILQFSPQGAKKRLEELPWVKSATVERRLPDVIYVQLQEKRPLALWQSNEKLHVIDQTGNVITGAKPAAFAKLPVIVGPDAPEHAHEIIALINSEPDFLPMIKAAVRVSQRRWNLRLKNNIDIKLPEEAPDKAWQSFAIAERKSAILNRDIVAVDLRLPDRMIVRTSDDVKPGKRRPQSYSKKLKDA